MFEKRKLVVLNSLKNICWNIVIFEILWISNCINRSMYYKSMQDKLIKIDNSQINFCCVNTLNDNNKVLDLSWKFNWNANHQKIQCRVEKIIIYNLTHHGFQTTAVKGKDGIWKMYRYNEYFNGLICMWLRVSCHIT